MPADLSRRGFIGALSAIGTGTLSGSAAGRVPPALRADTVVPSPRRGHPTGFETFFDTRVPAQLDDHDLVGATVAVVADGEVAFTKGYGHADLAAETPVRADETLFRIASTSKAVTGTAVMRAVEAGHVDLDTDVNQYLGAISVPDTYPDPVTLERLGTHTAGFESEVVGQYARDRAEARPLEAVLADGPPDRVHPPGEVAHYSNYGIALAGHAASRAAGASTFSSYARAAVFEPLGMDRSAFEADLPADLDAGLTTAYDYDEDAGEFEEIDVPFSLRRPGGSMVTTATDMARFMQLHLQRGRVDGEQLLAPETVAGMHARRFGNHPAVNGLGYMLFEDRRGGTRIVKHGGRLRGVTSIMALIPERDLGLFVAYNTTGANDAAEALFDAFVSHFAPPGPPEAVEPDGQPARADAITGWYRFTRVPESPAKPLFGIGGTVEVRVEDDGTLVTAPTAPGVEPIRWVELEPLVFRAVGDSPQVTPYDRLAFREEDGEITYAFFRSPTGSYRRLAAQEQPVLHVALLLAFVVAFLGAVLGWAGGALWRWLSGRPTLTGRERSLRWMAVVTGALLLAPLAGLAGWLTGGSVALSIGMPGWVPVALGLGSLGVLGAVAMVGAAVLAWRDGDWGVLGRVHYSALAVVSLGFAWLLGYWQLLWLPF